MATVNYIEISGTSGESALKTYFDRFFHKAKIGTVIAITGGTGLKIGTGKSYTALRLGELIDSTFSIDKVTYSPREFLLGLDSIEKTGKAGQVIIMDEGELTAPSHLWYSVTNKALSYTIATFRYLRCLAIIVTPSLAWIDKRMRVLISHWGYTVMTLDRDSKPVVRLYLYRIKTDMQGDKIFFQKIKFYDNERKQVVHARCFRVTLPNQALIDAYEKKSLAFKGNIRQDYLRAIDKFEQHEKEQDNKSKTNVFEHAKTLMDDFEVQAALAQKGKVTNALVQHVLGKRNLTIGHSLAGNISKSINQQWIMKDKS